MVSPWETGRAKRQAANNVRRGVLSVRSACLRKSCKRRPTCAPEAGAKQLQTSVGVCGQTGVVMALHAEKRRPGWRGLRLHSLLDPLRQTTVSWLDHEGP